MNVDTLRMRIWSIGQISKQMGISYLAARAHVLHAESASDSIKAEAASKISGTTVTATDIAGNDVYAAAAIACGMKPSQLGDGSFLKNLFAIITDPANQAAAMKFIQFLMTIIALFPKAVLPIVAKMIQGVDFTRITTGITELQAIQQDLSDKQTIAAASQNDLAKAQSMATTTAVEVTATQALFASEIEYLKKLLDQDPTAVDPVNPPESPASPTSGT